MASRIDISGAPRDGMLSYHQRVKGEKRQAAVAAAMQVFLEHGYERSSLQQIASLAGVSTATLFKRFPTKASLFEAIVLEFWSKDTQGDKFPQAGDPWKGLLKIGTDFGNFLRQPHLVALYRVLIAEAPRFPELGKLLTERGKLPYLQRVSDYLQSEVNAGTLDVKDVRRAARQFFAMIADQLFWPAMLQADFQVSDRDAKEAVDEAVKTIMARYGATDYVERGRTSPKRPRPSKHR